MISNAKVWRFVQPQYTPYMGQFSRDGVSSMSKYDYLPDDANVPYTDVHTNAGDFMYFPPHWWHQVRNKDPEAVGMGFGFRPIDDAPAAPAKPSPVAAPAKKSAKAPKKAAESPTAPARPSAPAAAPAEKKRWGDSDDDDDEPPAPPPLRPKKSAKAPKAAPGSPPKRKGPSDDDLLAACRSIKDAHPDYGVKRVFKELNARNPAWKVNERKVQKVMRNNGMLVI